MDVVQGGRYTQSASRITVAAHLFGALSLVLMLVWLLHYRGGLDYDSDYTYQIFNVHPFLMFFGFIFFAGEAMMAFKTVGADRKVQKFVHMALHLSAIVLGIVGICAVFKYHNLDNIENMYSLHSWIGLGTFILYGLQWVVGFATFLSPGAAPRTRAAMMPWHICGGRTLLYLAICAAMTGFMEKATFLRNQNLMNGREAHLVNFTALCILLFGIFVDLSVALARYV